MHAIVVIIIIIIQGGCFYLGAHQSDSPPRNPARQTSQVGGTVWYDIAREDREEETCLS